MKKQRVIEQGVYDASFAGGVLHRVAAGERIVLRDQNGVDRGAIISIDDLERLEELETKNP